MTGTDPAVPLYPSPLGAGVGAWFTGAPVGQPEPGTIPRVGNLSTARAHRPSDVARDRARIGIATGTDPRRWHLMRQVHGGAVARVEATTPVGAELRGVDALVTTLPDRPLVVQVADCVPVLLAGPGAIAAVHAGRRGVESDVVGSTTTQLRAIDGDTAALRAAIGPAIGGCCYEVPAAMQAAVTAVVPAAAATTSWGAPSLDLRAAVRAQLQAAGVTDVEQIGDCTRCTPGWFSHRADPTTGRQVGLIVRRAAGDRSAVA